MEKILPLLIFCGIVVLVVSVLTYVLKQRRQHVFKSLAKRRGLHFVATELGPKVTGLLDGRQVVITTTEEGSDEEAGVVVVKVSVELRHVPPTMFAESDQGLIGELNALGESRILTNSEEFDYHVLLKGNPQPVLDYWTEERQAQFISLIQLAECDQIRIENQTLSAIFRNAVADLERTDSLLQQLLNMAQSLDATSK